MRGSRRGVGTRGGENSLGPVWVAAGGCPPAAPAVPYVRALTHTVPLTMVWLRWAVICATHRTRVPSVDGRAIRHPCVDTLLNVDASSVGPSAGSMFRRPPSLRRVVLDRDCPGFIGTARTLRLPVILPAALGFPSLGGATGAPEICSHAAPPRCRWAGVLVVSGHPMRCRFSRGDDRISLVPAEPSVASPLPMVNSRT